MKSDKFKTIFATISWAFMIIMIPFSFGLGLNLPKENIVFKILTGVLTIGDFLFVSMILYDIFKDK